MWEYNYGYTSDELYHHGIIGMRWGVRRYQNADGTLTPAGKKRYNSMTPDKLQKTIYKQVKAERARQTGWSNQWGVNNTIGKNSKKVLDQYSADHEKWTQSKAYKSAVQKQKSLEKRAERDLIDVEKYDKKYEQIWKSVYDPKLDRSVTITGSGRQYVQEYLDTYGKDLNVGYLMDLGYSKQESEYLNKKIMKANKKLLDGM